MADPNLLTRQEAAHLLGLSPHTLLTYAPKVGLPTIRTPGGDYRYPEPAIRRLIAARAAGLTHNAIRMLLT